MAKQSQAAKRHGQSLVRRDRNYGYRSRLRTIIKHARQAILTDTPDKTSVVKHACRELDRMVTKGILKKNTASRRKARLEGALNGTVKLTVAR